MGNHNTMYSWHEIHAKRYIVAHGKVYDAPKFLLDIKHPGGTYSIEHKFGTDCTIDYDMHRVNGQKMWKKYYIGELKG